MPRLPRRTEYIYASPPVQANTIKWVSMVGGIIGVITLLGALGIKVRDDRVEKMDDRVAKLETAERTYAIERVQLVNDMQSIRSSVSTIESKLSDNTMAMNALRAAVEENNRKLQLEEIRSQMVDQLLERYGLQKGQLPPGVRLP